MPEDELSHARDTLLNQYRNNTTAFVTSVAGLGVILFTEIQVFGLNLSSSTTDFGRALILVVILGFTTGGILLSINRAFFWAQFSRIALSEPLRGHDDALNNPPDTIVRVHEYFQCKLNASKWKRMVTNGETGLFVMSVSISTLFWNSFYEWGSSSFLPFTAVSVAILVIGVGLWFNVLAAKPY